MHHGPKTRSYTRYGTTTCNLACWIVSKPRTSSGRDRDNKAARPVSSSSSELARADSRLLILSVSSDMTAAKQVRILLIYIFYFTLYLPHQDSSRIIS